MTVLRLQNGPNCALPNGVDWFKSSAYTTNEIVTIPDPDGGKGSEPTSIPSPFARMDVVRTAFKYVNDGATLDSTFYKIVSDCLDIAEIFFLQNQYQNDIRIIEWNKNSSLHILNAPNSLSEHQTLGDSLKMYLDQDATSFNFNACEKFYLLEYRHKIIGATSPITLFFTTANDLSWVDITFPNGDSAFDSNVCPLFDRSDDFQIMLYSMRKFFPDFNRYFRDLSNYMDICLEKLINYRQDLYVRIMRLTGVEYNSTNYDVIGNGIVLLNNLPLFGAKLVFADPVSDFEIASTKYVGVKKPLVLLKGHRGLTSDGRPMRYFNANYLENTPVGYFDNETDLDSRNLPGLTNVRYPYLTISDFLEPYIIRTVYPINKERFFDGNYNDEHKSDLKGYILPIKKMYFDFFDISDLHKLTPDGKLFFEIIKVASNAVKVILRVPVKNRSYITYERIYYPPTSENLIEEPDLNRNRGSIIENQFSLLLYPFLKITDDSKNHYRVCIIDRDILPLTRTNKYNLNFYNNTDNQIVNIKAIRKRSKKENEEFTSDYYVIEKGFDYIEIKNNWTSGIVIPKFKPLATGGAQFTFAVDFGTTNTHIEYRIDGGNPQPLEIEDEDKQIVTLYDPKIAEKDQSLSGTGATPLLNVLNEEMMPDIIGKKHEYRFPTRTVISHHHKLDLNTATFALADFNLSFYYEKYSRRPKINKTRTNLKWSNYVQDSREIKAVEAYFENLILLIRNKILLNGGDLDRTIFIWFFPSSMLIYRQNMLEYNWNNLFAKYITSTVQPVKLSESIAPFYYFNARLGIAATDSPVVSMDIGGGTSDIVIYTNNTPQILTSFRFAANAIFGDAFNGSPQINGFVLKYLNKIDQLLKDNKQHDLVKVLEDIKGSDSSDDIIAFFFSIENNKKIKDQNIPISFNKELCLDNDMKIIFLLFYSSLIYHLAKVMKAYGLHAPRYITFSGNGSKIVNIISAKADTVEKFTKILFEKVLGGNSISRIELKQVDEPKEITCKGGLMINPNINFDVNLIKSVLLGGDNEGLLPKVSKTYNTLNQEDEKSVIREYNNFLDLFFSLNTDFNFTNNFGVNPLQLEKCKEILTEDAMEFLKSGIENKLKDLNGNENIDLEETLFFYPLIGGLNRLAFKIYSEMQ